MDFTGKELAVLNQMISIALLSGEVEFDDVSKAIHKKVTEEIRRRNSVQCITQE